MDALEADRIGGVLTVMLRLGMDIWILWGIK